MSERCGAERTILTFPFGVVERRESVSEQHGALFALERTEPAGETGGPLTFPFGEGGPFMVDEVGG